jgi:hypothetical protein
MFAQVDRMGENYFAGMFCGGSRGKLLTSEARNPLYRLFF